MSVSGSARIRMNWNMGKRRKQVDEAIDEAVRDWFVEKGERRQLVREKFKEKFDVELKD